MFYIRGEYYSVKKWVININNLLLNKCMIDFFLVYLFVKILVYVVFVELL